MVGIAYRWFPVICIVILPEATICVIDRTTRTVFDQCVWGMRRVSKLNYQSAPLKGAGITTRKPMW